MVKKKQDQLETDQLNNMLCTLESAIILLQNNINKEVKKGTLDVIATSRVFKLISDSLGQIYKIKFGKAALEKTMQMIGELQMEMAKVEQVNAERERRARSKPLLQVVGELVPEDEIRLDEPGTEVAEHNKPMLPSPEGKAAIAIEKAIEAGIRKRNGSQR